MVLLAHVVLSTGLALMFTPLFTAGLGALPTRLYSHGSAMVGTMQQVAGAAGTALFVTVLTLSAAGAAASGASAPEATEAGVRSAFLCGGIISLLAVVGSFGVRRPAGTAGTESAAGAED